MHYVNQMKETIDRLNAEDSARADRVQEFRAHLLSPKFHPIQQDGSRGDWISTAEVMNWLRYIEDTTQTHA